MISAIIEYCKTLYHYYFPCSIDQYFGKLDDSMQLLIDKCENIEEKLEHEIKMLTEDVELYRGMLGAIAEAVPDMMWYKTLDGKYVYANNAIKKGLLLDNFPEGKDDITLAKAAKEKYGDANHEFGQTCGNSDLVIIDTLEPQRFLESGKVKGKMLYLEVFKAPLFIGGQLKGVVGIGRDMTEYVEAYRDADCIGCGKSEDIFKMFEFKG